jgi:Alginate export
MSSSLSQRMLVPLLACVAFPGLSYSASLTDELSDLREALSFGKVSGTARYRYERVDQSSFAKNAHASTLRGALGYETKNYKGFTTFVQFEGIFDVGQDSYRNATNGKTTYPAVLDTPTVEMNQAYVKYAIPKDQFKTSITVGRQEIILGNQRLVGPVAWRQDQQTFDSAGITTTPYMGNGMTLSVGYNYINRVNRIFPDSSIAAPFQGRLDMDTHLAQGTLKLDGFGQLHAYGLFLDYDSAVAAVTNNSSSTIGARVSGAYKRTETISLLYGAEYAKQGDFGSNTNSYDAAYYQVEGGVGLGTFSIKYGYNVLEGDGATDKFTTPLATGHAFNGWDDVFLNTPNAGLEAHAVTVSWAPAAVAGLTLSAMGYSFSGNSISDHYGDEIDLMAEYKVPQFPGLLVALKFAKFKGDETANMAGASQAGAAADSINKFWVFTQYTF